MGETLELRRDVDPLKRRESGKDLGTRTARREEGGGKEGKGRMVERVMGWDLEEGKSRK